MTAEMSVRMSNLEHDRDERDDDSHEDRGISEYAALRASRAEPSGLLTGVLLARTEIQEAPTRWALHGVDVHPSVSEK